MMSVKVFQVDAFTDEPFCGNPAAVCLLSELRSAEWMQKVAGEMNLPETAFLRERDDGFDLRWFTPKAEIDLCGHATLASAHVLWEVRLVPRGRRIEFQTRSGALSASCSEGLIILDFPAIEEEAARAPDELIEALGVTPVYVGKNRFDYLVEVGSEREVRKAKPDLGRLAEIDVRGVILTARSATEDFDFVSRFFAPGIGIGEDPVTGSAHCCLGPYWRERLGKDTFVAYQASERGGVVHVTVQGDRVLLGGRAVTVLEGEIFLS